MDDEPRQIAQDSLPSIRRRYVIIVSAFVALLAITATLAYRYSVSVGERSSAQAAWREIATVVLSDAFSELSRTRQLLHDFLLRPSDQAQRSLEVAHKRLDNALARLASHLQAGADPDLIDISQALHADAADLRDRSAELARIRHDPNRWFPSNLLIENQLQPRNAEIRGTLELLIDDLPGDAPVEMRRALHELRKNWLRLIDEARLIIANRFGAHAQNPEAGMAARYTNAGTYEASIHANLLKLQRFSASESAPLLLQEQLAAMQQTVGEWFSTFHRMYHELLTERWRVDLIYLREQIDPLVGQMQQRLGILRIELHAQARQQVDTLGRTGDRLSKILFATFGLMTLLAVLGYLSLDRLILRPIRELTETLQHHADQPSEQLPRMPAVRETHELVSAFSQMQEMVRERERKLDHLAHHDPLTDLPNRSLLRRRLAAAIDEARRHGMLVGLLFIDLDRFKQVNDSHGHAVGDKMLVQISHRLLKVFRQDDLVARLGGDEFAVLLENLHDRDEMTRLADKALEVIKRPYHIDNQLFYSGASIGIAVAPDHGIDPDRLLQQADTAMYAAKRDEDASYCFVSDELTIDAAHQHALENELREAVDEHLLQLHFQPVCRTDDRQIASYEALLRWPHAKQGLLSPEAFMDALADAGLCTRISDWILDQIQQRSPGDGAVVSINLSARLLHDEAFAERLFERLDSGRLIARQLVIEITEDTLETDLRAATRVLHELKRRGVKVALDDFGTGKASLSHLRHFPFDYLKIDQSFVAGIGHDESDEKLIQAIIRLAHALDMQVVTEGVETEAQFAFLAAEACDFVQGYLVGRPAAA